MDGYISKEQFYKIAHIRKSTALHLIESGLIPAIKIQEKDTRYYIHTSDVEYYMKDRIDNPQKYGLVHGNLTQCFTEPFKPGQSAKLRRSAKEHWKNIPAALTIVEASELLGYQTQTIHRWRKKLNLPFYFSERKMYLTKNTLIKLLCNKKFHGMVRKSPQHMELIKLSLQDEIE